MLLDNSVYPPLPRCTPQVGTSYYPYPVSARSDVHKSIRGLVPSPQPGPSSGLPIVKPGVEALKAEQRALDRAGLRAVMGKRPAGVGLGREAEDLSDEEDALEDEKANINMFGHRFLLPFGRRLTQMEMDTAPSPTPSEADQDRRQEDRNMASPPLVGDQTEDIGPGGEVDLDASVVDLDASEDDLDASMEGEEGEEGEEGDMEE